MGYLGLDTRGNPAFTGSQLLLNSRGLCDTTKYAPDPLHTRMAAIRGYSMNTITMNSST